MSGVRNSNQSSMSSGNIAHKLSLQERNLSEAHGYPAPCLQTFSVQWGQRLKFTDNESKLWTEPA